MRKTQMFKDQKKTVLILVICLIALTAITAALAVFAMQEKDVWVMSALASAFAPEPVEDDEPESTAQWSAPVKLPRPDSFDRPGEMRAVYLKAGEDFFISGSEGEDELKAQIDEAIELAQNKTMNTVIIDPMMSDGRVIHPSSSFHEAALPIDAINYIIERARSLGMYTYCIYYILPDEMTGKLDLEGQIDTLLIDRVLESADTFARRYEISGVLLDSYFLMDKADRYDGYARHGAAIGYKNYMYTLSDVIFSGVVDTFNMAAPDVEVGLISEAVWANDSEVEEGSATKAGFTMYGTGHCDVKSYIERGLVDFVAVRAYDATISTSVPYKEVMAWWSDITVESDVPLYMIHAAHKVGSSEAGWDQYDQLPKQVIEAREHEGFSGSIFNSMTWLKEDPKESVTKLLGLYSGLIRPTTVLSELALTKPSQRTFSTLEPSITFAGASDPNVEVTLNGEPISIDENGYFSITVDLDPGLNKYTFHNKGKSIVYNITRRIEVLKPDSYGPMGSLEVDGGTSITITAVAYNESTVYAVIGGTRVNLYPDEFQDDSTITESAYWRYSGVYTAPQATDKEQNLGSIQLYGTWTWSGNSAATFEAQQTLGSVKVNKKLAIGDGRPVIVTANVAETFPIGVLNDISDPNYFPIVKGAIDIAVGTEMFYSDGSKTHSYYNLASGVRVYSKDIAPLTTGETPGGNRITGYSVTANSRYTTVTISMTQQVSYSAKYDRDSFSIKFNYTTSAPGSMSLSQNPLFGQASWNGVTLRLDLLKRNVFMGYKAWYDGSGNLVLQFNNPPGVSGTSLSGVTVVVDPGHGGSDAGATGFLAAYPEKVINEMIATELTRALQARGATVIKLATYSANVTMESRILQARAANPHMYISIHANSAVRSSARGTEVFYFNDYSYDLAYRSSGNIASAMATDNRGAKWGLYYVTRDSQFPSILCEVGFMSNQNEYYKLLNQGYQEAVAVGICNAVSGYLQAITPARWATGTEVYSG